MKIKGLAIAVLIVFGIAFSVQTFAQTSRTVSIRIGREKPIAGGVRVRFLEVTEDSRCPRGVNCIQAGTAKIRVRVAKGSRADTIELDTNAAGTPFAGYRFKLTGLSPEPQANAGIGRKFSVATILITKAR